MMESKVEMSLQEYNELISDLNKLKEESGVFNIILDFIFEQATLLEGKTNKLKLPVYPDLETLIKIFYGKKYDKKLKELQEKVKENKKDE